MPPPCRYPLFPYTTLFRSVLHDAHQAADVGQRLERAVLGAHVEARLAELGRLEHVDEDVVHGHTGLLRDLAFDAAARDRKSTRLNSSHSQISYAVFCLKKQ